MIKYYKAFLLVFYSLVIIIVSISYNKKTSLVNKFKIPQLFAVVFVPQGWGFFTKDPKEPFYDFMFIDDQTNKPIKKKIPFLDFNRSHMIDNKRYSSLSPFVKSKRWTEIHTDSIETFVNRIPKKEGKRRLLLTKYYIPKYHYWLKKDDAQNKILAFMTYINE